MTRLEIIKGRPRVNRLCDSTKVSITMAMDLYAQQESIAFAEWTAINLWTTYKGKWFEYRNEDNPITGEQLYTPYKSKTEK